MLDDTQLRIRHDTTVYKVALHTSHTDLFVAWCMHELQPMMTRSRRQELMETASRASVVGDHADAFTLLYSRRLRLRARWATPPLPAGSKPRDLVGSFAS